MRGAAPAATVDYASGGVRRGGDVREGRGTVGRQRAPPAASRAPRSAATAAAAGPAGSRASRRRSRPAAEAGSCRTCSRRQRPAWSAATGGWRSRGQAPAAPRSRTSGSRRHGGARRRWRQARRRRWQARRRRPGSNQRRQFPWPAFPLLPAGRSAARRRVVASTQAYHDRARPRFEGTRPVSAASAAPVARAALAALAALIRGDIRGSAGGRAPRR